MYVDIRIFMYEFFYMNFYITDLTSYHTSSSHTHKLPHILGPSVRPSVLSVTPTTCPLIGISSVHMFIFVVYLGWTDRRCSTCPSTTGPTTRGSGPASRAFTEVWKFAYKQYKVCSVPFLQHYTLYLFFA